MDGPENFAYKMSKFKTFVFFTMLISLSRSENFLESNENLSNIEEREARGRQLQNVKSGMTFGYFGYVNGDQEIFGVHCAGSPPIPPYNPYGSTTGSCNTKSGDTPCNHSLPILCINKVSFKRPCYQVKCGSASMAKEYYCGWSEGYLALTDPVQGTLLTSRDAASKICADKLGAGFRMAEFHDGRYTIGMDSVNYCYKNWPSSTNSGGWGFYGYGARGPTWTRFWVEINDQKANCWS